LAVENITDKVKWDAHGLVPAVVQDEPTGDVVMLAYMNAEALDLTIETHRAHYWSRSRRKLWLKGETSGHFQEVKSVNLDCDGDAILLVIEQKTAACHTGYWSCFYRTWKENGWTAVGEKVFDEEAVYGDKG
jgi:phosphoribosyl-AMP cyclohydrolase / phosphoribosyl-ATP pyrophosphohydrolase